MYLKIKDLKEYPRLYEIAYQSARTADYNSHRSNESIDNLEVSYMQDWDGTEQGANFWSDIHNGLLGRSRIRFPEWEHLFYTGPLELETKNNGLWQ